MIIETKFSNGDKVFSRKTDNKTGVVSCNGPLTVGMVRVVSVKSPGVRGMEIFASYQAYTKYFEEYMCVETGIYSGHSI